MDSKYDLDILLSPQYFDDEDAYLGDPLAYIILYRILQLTRLVWFCLLLPIKLVNGISNTYDKMVKR
ncbi:MAG: hypothetical protein HZC02_01945 [Candidatus Levybacteria bacterium]|nr:hypothetical protein [Candidatus Levybacteria bacterium]